jgi:hypothetical protein
MELEAVGELRVDEIAALMTPKEPVTVPIVAYHQTSGKKKTTKVEFKGTAPFGAEMEILRGMAGGGVKAESILAYIEKSLTEDGMVSWAKMIDDPNYVVSGETLGRVYSALVGAHANPIPMKPRAGSRRTTASTRPTSRAVVKKQAGRREALRKS